MEGSSPHSLKLAVVCQISLAAATVYTIHNFVDKSKITFQGTDTVEGRIAYTFRYLALSLVPVVVTLGSVANARFFSSAINPMSGNDHHVHLKQRILSNTLEQFILHAFTVLAFSTFQNAETFKFVPTLCFLFVAARIFFIIGYHIHPMVRAFGFALTFMPTALTLGHVIYTMYNSSFLDWVMTL